jgi:exosortase/archaeosortase family protein
VKIVRGCDAFDPIAVFVALVLASPIAWRKRLTGIALGVLFLLVINLVRIASLVLIGIHAPRVFEWMHLELWQALLIVLAIGLWAAWSQWALRPRPVAAAACA